MKKFIYIIAVSLSFGIFSCENEKIMYDYPDNRIGFIFPKNTDSTLTKTFVYDEAERVRDTVFIKLKTIGFLYNYDRAITFKQVTVADTINAEANVHYLGFDSPEYKGRLCVPADKDTVTIPIILLRDKSLLKETVLLRIAIAENEFFKLGFPKEVVKNVVISEELSMPSDWPKYGTAFNPYGKVKHRFLIEKSGLPWTNETMEQFKVDLAYFQYLKAEMKIELEKENARLKIEDPDNYPLSEADGTEVKFS